MTTSTKNFYTRLPVLHYTLNQLLEDTKDFHAIPEDWFFILTDIVNSTEHFKAERYQEVNFVAVSSASVVLNVARRHNISVPFIYGGDGATLLVPPQILADCKARLATLHENTNKRFNMDLRVSIVPVSTVVEAGFPIKVAKLYISSHYHQAIFLGDGMRYAESLMKQAPEYLLPKNTKKRPIDLSGLECKWSALFPPREGDEVISLIVYPKGEKEPEDVFRSALDKLDEIYGHFTQRHPIHPKVLSPTTNWKTIIHASHLRHGKAKIRFILHQVILGITKSIYLSGKVFFHKVIRGAVADMSTSSDTLKVDNTLKTVFAGAPMLRKDLLAWLDEEEKKGELVYGISVAKASVMTCYIKESENTHVRFLDGFGGGYTLAAIELKKKLNHVKK